MCPEGHLKGYFAQVETQWASKLASVSAQLAAATTGETPEGIIDLTEDEVAEAAKAESEVRMDVDRETKAFEARQQCLTRALNTVLKDASESAAKAANDARERTAPGKANKGKRQTSRPLARPVCLLARSRQAVS